MAVNGTRMRPGGGPDVVPDEVPAPGCEAGALADPPPLFEDLPVAGAVAAGVAGTGSDGVAMGSPGDTVTPPGGDGTLGDGSGEGNGNASSAAATSRTHRAPAVIY